MDTPPQPNIVTSLDELLGPGAPVFTGIEPDTGVSASDAITSATQITLKGTAEAGSTLNLYRSDLGKIAEVTVGGDGNWVYAHAATLAGGEYRFTANATAGGHTGVTTAPFIVTIMTTPPAAPVIYDVALEAGRFIATGETIPGGYVSLYCAQKGAAPLNPAAVQADDAGVWTYDFDAAGYTPAGSFAFTAKAADAAGNVSASSATVTVNTTVATPAITGITPDSGASGSDGIVNTNAVRIRGTAAAGDTVSIIKAGVQTGASAQAAGGNWEIDLAPLALADGAHALSARAVNGPSTSPASTPFVVTIDTAAPSVLAITRHAPAAQE
ncbi:MAG: Ig-like domain-containing protein, partial [Opitutaceae bacterium]|nr:Ig-like domain-containing protein [Opitutaceae bacterium]